jgi:hypothetical protein
MYSSQNLRRLICDGMKDAAKGRSVRQGCKDEVTYVDLAYSTGK